MISRRTFIESLAVVPAVSAVGAPAVQSAGAAATQGPLRAPADLPVVFFSKHLAELNWSDLARASHEMGFAGIDLTVRPGGHVLPERVAEDLPRAVAAIRDAGSRVLMLTTGLTHTSDPAARPTMETARAVDVRLLKAGYYRYKFEDVRREVRDAAAAYAGLVALAGASGVLCAYHNHSGSYIGAPVWDAVQMVEPLPAGAAGYYFDVRHATVEGGDAGWRVATQLVASRLHMLAVKDFYWDRHADGRARIVDCPIGEGMVNWPAFFAEIAQARFAGPVSVHVEYEPGGRTPVEKRDRMMEAAARDRARIEGWIAAAQQGA